MKGIINTNCTTNVYNNIKNKLQCKQVQSAVKSQMDKLENCKFAELYEFV